MRKIAESLICVLFPVFAMIYLIWRIGWTIPFDHGIDPWGNRRSGHDGGTDRGVCRAGDRRCA